MDKKDNRSSEREPEGNSFDYEELVNEPAEDQDYEEYRKEDDFDEDEEVVFRFRPWMIPVFAGMMILAILICIPLWKLSSHSGGAGDSDALVTATEAQTTEAAGIPETAVATPCWPAPVSAMTRVFPIFFASSTWPSTLLILCAPVWFRSSRFR